ncbi:MULTISPECIES: site-2 protease family protein [unclassified Parvimonas]|uniref:site-2 protease family protein n=1 Tax=unclassified Parvimonas TaxID=1151464 RepID=UPI002B49B73F|nr:MULTISPECIES: site-2 protease family protein [unclassified Parvimonas]MEB3024533.1 site-2 protease family protein [Parvimonas sp. M13]MEB3088637.1 site-2 protease family protein [Parvimonas sp. M20]
MNSIAEHLIIAVALMLVIIVSRVFQSYVALALGDDTPKLNGSTSFNPINHIDLMGFVFFVFFKFGWAKPVEINMSKFKNRFWGKIIYSLSHAFICFVIALLSTIVYLYIKPTDKFVITIFQYIFSISIIFGIIEMLPFPPFDGAIFISAFLSREVEYEYFKLSSFTNLIIIGLILTGAFKIFLSPIVSTVGKFILNLATMLVM